MPQTQIHPLATPQTQPQGSQPQGSQPERRNWTTRLKDFRRRVWTERHQQSEAQKRRADKMEQYFADNMTGILLGFAGVAGSSWGRRGWREDLWGFWIETFGAMDYLGRDGSKS